MPYAADMSRQSPRTRGARDFSSPQIRVRGVEDFPYHPDRRLRLPNERRSLRRRLAWLPRILIPLAIMGGIGVGVFFGARELLKEDEATNPVETAAQTQAAGTGVGDSASTTTQQSEAGASAEPAGAAAETVQATQSDQAETTASTTETAVEGGDTAAVEPEAEAQTEVSGSQPGIAHPAQAEPSISTHAITPAQIGGAALTSERVTAEPIPAGIPRNLADGSDYDPTEPATVFTDLWPVGTTLRLTRLPGATLLSDEEQAEVVGTEVLVVVRGSDNSNTDLLLSPAAFDQVAIYGVERIIALRVEVTAPPP